MKVEIDLTENDVRFLNLCNEESWVMLMPMLAGQEYRFIKTDLMSVALLRDIGFIDQKGVGKIVTNYVHRITK